MLLINLGIFVLSCLVLILSGSFLVKSLVKISSFLKISGFVMGFVLMAFATTIPELFVGITSGLAKNTALSLGNVIGSNIANLSLIIGIGVVLSRGIKIKKEGIKKDAFFMFLIMLLPLVLLFIGRSLSKLDGLILIIVLLFYIKKVLKERKRYSKEFSDKIKRWEIVLNVLLFVVSLVLLFVSAAFVVRYGTLLSVDLLLPPLVIGLFLVALGTSLPELMFSVNAILKGQGEMALGDIMGAAIVNSTLVLGVTALIYPITAVWNLFLVSGIFMMVISFLFLSFVNDDELGLLEGISLIMLYVLFVIVEFYLGVRV